VGRGVPFKGKESKGRALHIAPQVDTATTKAREWQMVRTKVMTVMR